MTQGKTQGKHDAAVAGLAAAVATAEPTENGRLAAVVNFVTAQMGAMLAGGATVEDFLEALAHLHSEGHAIKALVKG